MKKVWLLFSIFFILSCSGNKSQQATLLYEQGKEQEERGAVDSAVVTYNAAINLLEQTDNKPLLGEVYNRIGNLYLDNALYPNAYEAFQTALKYNSLLAEKSKASYSLRGMGKSYAYRLMPDSVLHFHLLANQLIPLIKDTDEIAGIYNNLATTYLSLKQYGKAAAYNTKTLQIVKDSIDIYRCYSIKADIFIAYHQYDSAQIYLKKGICSHNIYTKAGCYLQLSELAKQIKDPNYVQYLEISRALRDSIENNYQTADIAHIEQHYIKENIHQEKQLRIAWIIGILIISLFLTYLLLCYHRHKINMEKKNILKLNKQLQENKVTIQELNSQLAQIKKEHNLTTKQKKSAEEQNEIYNRLKETQEIILTRIKQTGENCTKKFIKSDRYSIIKGNKEITELSKKQRQEYRASILKEFSPYIKHLSSFTKMSPDDHYLCCLILIGFNTKECACFRGLSDDAIRSQKIRIRKKIVESFGTNMSFEYI